MCLSLEKYAPSWAWVLAINVTYLLDAGGSVSRRDAEGDFPNSPQGSQQKLHGKKENQCGEAEQDCGDPQKLVAQRARRARVVDARARQYPHEG